MMKNRRMEKMIYPDFINKIRIDFGKRIAVKENETEISYEELGRMSDSIGAYLLENGTRPRENVLIQLENSILFVACLFAVLRIGAVPVLIYPACRENEITSIAENTNPSTYISFRSYKGYDYSELATRISQKVNSIKNMYFSDELESLDIKKYRLDVCDIGRPSQDDMAILILSGGSTGIPKLIARKHGEHITAARLCANACGLKQDSVFLLSMPAAHNFNLAGPGLLGTLLMGGKVVMCKNSNPAEIVSLIRKEKITETALIPSLALECIIYAKKNLSLSVFDSLRLVQLGGAVCPADVVMQVYEDMQCTPQQIYGMGEGIIFSTSPDDPIERILYYQGENISPWDQVRIVDEQGNQVPEGEYGELIAKGPCIITGYYNKEANRNKFTKDGFYRTGDRVRLVEGKYLQVSGRMDDMINKGGEKIYPAEVEMHINTCKGVESSTVLGIADSSYGQLLCAFVITENNEVVFIILLMAVILGRKISNERKIIGVLSALGYKKRELALHYSMFGVIPGLIGSILGIVISVNTIDLFVPALFEETEPLLADYSIQISWILIALLVPTISYFLATYITALRAMRADTIEMLKGNGKDTGKQKMKMEHSKLNFKTKFKIRQIFGNFSRTVLVIVSVSIAGFLLVFCYSCIDSMDAYVANTVKEIGTVEYEYFLNTIQTEEPEQGKAVISAYFEGTKNNETVVLMGTGDNGYVNTDLEDGTGKADLNSDDFYITSMAARVFGVEKGDKFKFRDVASMKEYQISIAGVVQNDSQAIIYTSRERACSLLELPKEYYNLVMSDKAVDYTDADLASTVTKKALGDQIKTVADQMRDMVGMIFVFAMLICVIVVYLMVNMLLTENTTSISMLKVLGYKEKEINKMVIHIYHWLLPIGILMGLLLGMAFTKVNFQESVAQYKTYIETSISVSSVIKFVIVILISYIVSILLLSRKVGKVNMVESLKDNRE